MRRWSVRSPRMVPRARALALALLATLARARRSRARNGLDRRARRGLAAPDRRLRLNRLRRPSPHPARPPSETSGATQALLAQSRAARTAGNYAQANATIERALRIAPSDASLWVELGEIELATGNAAQAATLARKALTLAAPNDSGDRRCTEALARRGRPLNVRAARAR